MFEHSRQPLPCLAVVRAVQRTADEPRKPSRNPRGPWRTARGPRRYRGVRVCLCLRGCAAVLGKPREDRVGTENAENLVCLRGFIAARRGTREDRVDTAFAVYWLCLVQHFPILLL